MPPLNKIIVAKLEHTTSLIGFVFRKVECFTRILEERLLEHSGPEQTFTEAVLELPLDTQESEKSCLYYLVDPYNRNVGWFEDYDGAEIAAYIAGVPSAEYLCTYVTSCRRHYH